MMAWYVCLFLVFSINIVLKSSKVNQRKIAIISTFFVLFLFQALRNVSVGIDLSAYQSFYYNFHQQSWSEILSKGEQFGLEYTFVLFCKVIAMLTNGNWQIFIAIISFFNNYVLCKMIYKYARNTFYAFSIYMAIGLFVFSFSGIRQSIAISFCMLSFDKLCSKKYASTFFYLLLACLFHKSAIVFMAALLINRIKIKPSSLFWVSIVFLIISIWGHSIISVVVKLLLPSFESYLDIEHSSFGFFGLFLLLSLYMLSYLNYNKKTKSFYNSKFIYLTILAVICQAFGNLSTITMRITMYFIPYLILGLANSDKLTKFYPYDIHAQQSMYIINKNKDKSIIRLMNLMICIYVVFIIFEILMKDLNSGYLNVVPYRFFWEAR